MQLTEFTPILASVAALLFSVLILHHVLILPWRDRRKGLPPTLYGWPLLGLAFYLSQSQPLADKLMKFKRKFPHVVRLKLGSRYVIVLNSLEAIKEALINKGDNFSGRELLDPMKSQFHFGKGIVTADGARWQTHRRFALQTLKNFGFGKNISQEIVQNEAAGLISLLRELSGPTSQANKSSRERLVNLNRGVDIMTVLFTCVSNVVCSLVIGEKPGLDDHEFQEAIRCSSQQLNETHRLKTMIFAFDFIVYLPTRIISTLLPRVRRIFHNFRVVNTFVRAKIEAHVKSGFDPNCDESNDYIEAFLKHRHKLDLKQMENKDSKSDLQSNSQVLTNEERRHTFGESQLQREIQEFFVAGTDTTSNTLSWGLIMLAIYQDIQEKCRNEIRSKWKPGAPIGMDLKAEVPYTRAVIDEVQRFKTLVPTSIIHRNFKDDTISGYCIPANSIIAPFLHGVHHDPQIWEHPESFYPEHFLVKSNDQHLEYRPRSELIPFSLGKRACLGESLALIELFIFFTSIVANFRFELDTTNPKKISKIMRGNEGLVLSPKRFRLKFHYIDE